LKVPRFLKEPLVHFLVAGAALFILFGWVGDEMRSARSRRIVVDDEALEDYLQYSAKTLTPDGLDGLSPQEYERLVDNFVRDEALFREARALGLDTSDYGFRRQLVRRLESVNRMVVSSAVDLTERDLGDFLAAHQDRYFLPPTITFTHVFFSFERHGDERARSLAESTLRELNTKRVSFHEAPARGDRFLYHRNYAAKDAQEVASHFGRAMQQELFAIEPDDTRWIGPLRSPYGYHLVMLTGTSDGRMPALEEIRPRVEADAAQARIQAELDRITRSIVSSYDVRLDATVRERLGAAEP
jgi:hypothetical protein